MAADELIPLLEARERTGRGGELAVMLTGGGARAAYQAGLLRGLARHFPDLHFDVLTGVSAGAINAAFLAAHHGTLRERSEKLADLWRRLSTEDIFRFDALKLLPFRSALASVFPRRKWSRPRGLFDTTPLRHLLEHVMNADPDGPIDGIIRNIRSGSLHSIALITLDYSTGQSVRWVQGRDFDVFQGPNQRAEAAELCVKHVLASAALPFLFPAIRVGSTWHGDGGIRLAAPLSPAVHLGARRIVAMSTGYQRTSDEASMPVVTGYPPAAQILSQLMNAVFLDAIDQDVERMQRLSDMVRKLDPNDRAGFRPIDLCVLRPSIDIGKLAAEYEHYLPRSLKLLTRALGARETDSPDFLSMLMFEPHYTAKLIEIGEADVGSRLTELRDFFGFEEAAQYA